MRPSLAGIALGFWALAVALVILAILWYLELL
jgi:hypothetical protein